MLKVGDRVWLTGTISGAYAQYALCNETQAHPLAANASFDAGAAMYTAYGTAYNSLYQVGEIKEMIARKAKKSKDPVLRLLIHGASGGTGIACIQVARQIPGVEIFGTAGSEEGLALLKKEGAHHVFSHKKEGYITEIEEAAKKEGIDLVMEMLAGVNLENDLKLLGVRGRIVIIGTRGQCTINPWHIAGKRAEVRGMYLGQRTEPEELEEISAYLSDALAHDRIAPPIQKIYKLSEIGQAHADIMNSTVASLGKLLVRPWQA